jgi:hypothetical protein
VTSGHPPLRRCLLAACAVAVGLAGLVVPAGAATDPCTATTTLTVDVNITVWQPGPKTADADAHQCTPTAGSTLSGSWNVRMDAFSVSSLRSFTVSIVPKDGSIPPLPDGATTARTYGGLLGSGKLSDTIEMPWDTGALTRYNGTYQISATAVSALGTTAHALVGNLLLNSPPAQPAVPATRLDGSAGVVAWSANSEPDLTGYQVLRSVAGGAYSQLGTTSGTGFRDPSVPQNKPLTYEIVAVRASPVDPNGIASAASAASSPLIATPPLPPPVASAPAGKSLPRSTVRNAPAQDPGVSTFAPLLPFAQAVPTATATLPDIPIPSAAPAALPSGGGYSKTSLLQKLPYWGAAIGIIVLAFFIIKYARRLIRGDASGAA